MTLTTGQGRLGGGSVAYDRGVLTAAYHIADQKNPSSLRSKLGILRKHYESSQGEINLTQEGYKNYLAHFDNGIAYAGGGSLNQY